MPRCMMHMPHAACSYKATVRAIACVGTASCAIGAVIINCTGTIITECLFGFNIQHGNGVQTTTHLVETEQMQTRNPVRGQEPSIEHRAITDKQAYDCNLGSGASKTDSSLTCIVTLKVNWSGTCSATHAEKHCPRGKYLGDHRIAQTNFTVQRDVSEPLQLFIMHHPSFYGQNGKNAGASCRASSFQKSTG